jgi:hypothetical protein
LKSTVTAWSSSVRTTPAQRDPVMQRNQAVDTGHGAHAGRFA